MAVLKIIYGLESEKKKKNLENDQMLITNPPRGKDRDRREQSTIGLLDSIGKSIANHPPKCLPDSASMHYHTAELCNGKEGDEKVQQVLYVTIDIDDPSVDLKLLSAAINKEEDEIMELAAKVLAHQPTAEIEGKGSLTTAGIIKTMGEKCRRMSTPGAVERIDLLRKHGDDHDTKTINFTRFSEAKDGFVSKPESTTSLKIGGQTSGGTGERNSMPEEFNFRVRVKGIPSSKSVVLQDIESGKVVKITGNQDIATFAKVAYLTKSKIELSFSAYVKNNRGHRDFNGIKDPNFRLADEGLVVERLMELASIANSGVETVLEKLKRWKSASDK